MSASEKEDIKIHNATDSVRDALIDANIDSDGDGSISKREFQLILQKPQALSALKEAGVDSKALWLSADFLSKRPAGRAPPHPKVFEACGDEDIFLRRNLH